MRRLKIERHRKTVMMTSCNAGLHIKVELSHCISTAPDLRLRSSSLRNCLNLRRACNTTTPADTRQSSPTSSCSTQTEEVWVAELVAGGAGVRPPLLYGLFLKGAIEDPHVDPFFSCEQFDCLLLSWFHDPLSRRRRRHSDARPGFADGDIATTRDRHISER